MTTYLSGFADKVVLSAQTAVAVEDRVYWVVKGHYEANPDEKTGGICRGTVEAPDLHSWINRMNPHWRKVVAAYRAAGHAFP